MKRKELFFGLLAFLLLGFISCNKEIKEKKIESLEISPNSIELSVGETKTIEVKTTPADLSTKPLFSSKNVSIASVDEKGTIKGISEGETTITATMGSLSATCSVKIKKGKEKSDVEGFLPSAKDFPSFEALQTKDINKISDFEKKLGLRNYYPGFSKPEQLQFMFMTAGEKANESNIKIVLYLCNTDKGNSYINMTVEKLSKSADLKSDAAKVWLKTNGFGTDLAYNSEKDMLRGYRSDKSAIAQLYISDKGTAVCQIYASNK